MPNTTAPRHPTRTISMIAAVARNRVIGVDGGLPWRLPDDMKWFKRTTTGHAVIMGRKNVESFGGLLPNRTNIVMTRNPAYTKDGAIVVHTLDEALAATGDDAEPFVVGGEAIYRLFLPIADRMYLTHVDAEPVGDTFFPEFDVAEWDVTTLERHPADARHAHAFTIRRYDRSPRK